MRPSLLYVLLATGLTGCGPTYSPDTYASSAVQQMAKAEQGVIVGVRDVTVSASGAVGTVTGAAAGGIAGSQMGMGPINAFTALGGSLVGGLAGNAVEHAAGDTNAFEYIVRKPNKDLVSVTQKDAVPLTLGLKVLVIAGTQARVVPDYTTEAPPEKPEEAAPSLATPRLTGSGPETTAPAVTPAAQGLAALPASIPSAVPAGPIQSAALIGAAPSAAPGQTPSAGPAPSAPSTETARLPLSATPVSADHKP